MLFRHNKFQYKININKQCKAAKEELVSDANIGTRYFLLPNFPFPIFAILFLGTLVSRT